MIFMVLVFQVVHRMRQSLGWVAGYILCYFMRFTFYQLRWAALWVALTFLERGHRFLSVCWLAVHCRLFIYCMCGTYQSWTLSSCVCVTQVQWHTGSGISFAYVRTYVCSAWVFMYVGHSCLAHLQQLLKPWVFSGHIEIGHMAQNMTQVGLHYLHYTASLSCTDHDVIILDSKYATVIVLV